MFCTKCGADNADKAVYCRKCGEPVAAEDETQVAVRRPADVRSESETEGRIFSVGPTMKFVYVGYLITALAALLLVAICSMFGISAWISVILGLLLLVMPLTYHVKQKLVRYTLTDTQIEVDRGLISRTTRNVPIRRIQDVTVSTSIFQRLLGFGDIVVDNASEDVGKIVFKNIDRPKHFADILLRQISLLDK